MRSEYIILSTVDAKTHLIEKIMNIECDGKIKVSISDACTKSHRQRGLQWQWNTDVALSGIGRNDDKNNVHIDGKYRFCVPILLRDDDLFPSIYKYFTENHGHDKKKMKTFISNYVHTEKLTVNQMSEYLMFFERYWLVKGVNLTNPDLYGIESGSYRVVV